jgi:cytochrome c oxidase subunit II
MSEQHFTTRRGFIAAMGFGGVSLYGLWTAFGAAPGPLALLRARSSGSDTLSASDAMANMDHGSAGSMASDAGAEFRAELERFMERYQMPDGSIYPRRNAGTVPALTESMAEMPAMKGMEHATGQATSDHGGSVDGHAPIEVLLLAERWYYEPALLRLDAGQNYRFRMLAADVSHGASIQFGRGGRMIRLRPEIETAFEASFDRAGSYLVYCTVYCGQGHDLMQARIDVV